MKHVKVLGQHRETVQWIPTQMSGHTILFFPPFKAGMARLRARVVD